MKIKIYQIYYENEQRAALDPAFTPLDNTANPEPHWFEWSAILPQITQPSAFADCSHIGFFSWKFGQKAQIEGQEAYNFITQNPDRDCYLFNSFTITGARFINVWEDAELSHPGITLLTKDLLAKAGYDIALDQMVNDVRTICYANFWVGSQKFWEAYLAFINPLVNILRQEYSQKRAGLWQPADTSRPHASYVPFVFERLFTTFLQINHSKFNTLSWTYTLETLRKRAPTCAELIQTCDFLKRRFNDSQGTDEECFSQYLSLRRVLSRQVHHVGYDSPNIFLA